MKSTMNHFSTMYHRTGRAVSTILKTRFQVATDTASIAFYYPLLLCPIISMMMLSAPDFLRASLYNIKINFIFSFLERYREVDIKYKDQFTYAVCLNRV